MHKKISHLESDGENFKPMRDRYFYGTKLLLEVENSCFTAEPNENVCIDGYHYKVRAVCFYPELLINDIQIENGSPI